MTTANLSRSRRTISTLGSLTVALAPIVLTPLISSAPVAAFGRLSAGVTECFSGELPTGRVVPEGALVIATVTGIQPDSIGFISLHRRDQAYAETSSLNINPGLNLANTTSYIAGPDGEICITSSVATNAAVDVIGFDVVNDVTQVRERVFDSRQGQRLAAGATRCFDGRLPSGKVIPEGAVVTATLTGIQPDAIGFISLHRRSQPYNETSSLNINPGLNLANTTSYIAGPGGEICMTASVPTNALLDVVNYDTTTANVAVNKRVLDTRGGQGLGSLAFPTSKRCFDADDTGLTLPPGAAVTATITGIQPDGIGFISVGTRSEPTGATSALNIKNGLNLAATTAFVIGEDGEFCLSSSSPTDATVDIISFVAEPTIEFINERIFDSRRAPLPEPQLGPTQPAFVDGDRSLIGRVTVDCRYGQVIRNGVGTPSTFFEVTVSDIPRTAPVGTDGVYNEMLYAIRLYAPPLAIRGQVSSRIDGDTISASRSAAGRFKYMRGRVAVLASAGSGNLTGNPFGEGVEGGTTFDVDVACRDS
jgi:hypothetical protein